jgi:hypothetical protein
MCPIANRQTVLESAHPEEGPIIFCIFFSLYSSYNFPALFVFEHDRTHF